MPRKTARKEKTILIAEDHPFLASVLSRLLSEQGYRTTVASNGVQALKRFEADPEGYDLVITNYTMPGFGGSELTAGLREKKYTGKILIMSFDNPRSIGKVSRKAGADAFLSKPFTPEDFLKAIETLIGPA